MLPHGSWHVKLLHPELNASLTPQICRALNVVEKLSCVNDGFFSLGGFIYERQPSIQYNLDEVDKKSGKEVTNGQSFIQNIIQCSIYTSFDWTLLIYLMKLAWYRDIVTFT